MRVGISCHLALALICAVVISTCSGGSSTVVKQSGYGKLTRHGQTRDMKIEEIALDKESKVEEAEKKNSTSFMSLLMSEKWMTPRFTHQLTDAFNSIGFPATVIAGIGFLVLIPIYLIAAGFSWLPLQKISNPPIQDEPDFSNYFYKAPAPAPEPYWASAASPAPHTHTVMYSYPPAPAPAPSSKHYSGYPAPAPAPHYGYPAPQASKQNYYNAPAPAPAPSMHYGYPDNDPSMNYYQQPAIVSAPAPSVQYGQPGQQQGQQQQQLPTSYGIPLDSGKVASKEDVKAQSRKERSIRNYVSDAQCVQRLACELGKASNGIQLPNWMKTVADMLPWKENNLVQESRKLLSSTDDCSHFICDSYEIVKTAL